MEPDIDYYSNLLAHGLLEVLPGLFHDKTDPRVAYAFRWMASQGPSGEHLFDPLYTIEGV